MAVAPDAKKKLSRLKSAVAGLSVIRFPSPCVCARAWVFAVCFPARGGLLIAQGRARSLFDRRFLGDFPVYESEKKGFIDIASRYLSRKALPVEWSKIQAPTAVPYDSLAPAPEDPAVAKVLLDRLVVLKLNGGLTTMNDSAAPISIMQAR
ncbi:hypothetical protein NL676_028238 [Syzygium grande]|nr:hypothetical protein NL676_028238 [Syzygium grande]